LFFLKGAILMTQGEKLLYFVAGTGIGAAIGVLFAPRAGKEVRNTLTRKARRGFDRITETVDEGRSYFRGNGGARVKVREFVGRGKRVFNESVESVKDRFNESIEAAKERYRAERPQSKERDVM
jgi:gas vesicle protein